MILEYHRPDTLEEALALLARQTPFTVPLAGGSSLNKPSRESFAVVDLQALPLDRLEARGNDLVMGATATLQALLEEPALPASWADVIRYEAAYNLRHVATVAGTLVAADGRSPFAAAMLALDASLELVPDEQTLPLGDFLPMRRDVLPGRLIVRVSAPLNARLSFHSVARTPADRPLACVAAASWPSGRTRIALGGFGSAPVLALDGTDAEGAEAAARDAYARAGDSWATAEYRQEAVAALTRRAMQALAAPPPEGRG